MPDDVVVSARLPARCPVLDVPISLTSYRQVLELIDAPPADRARCFAFCNVHSVMTARRDAELAAALHDADVAAPDGMPLVWALRRLADTGQQRVYGPDLMELALPHGVARGWRHFFYGTTPETLDALVGAAERLAPGLAIAGTLAPPFRALTAGEERGHVEAIRSSGATVLWLGLGMPKQELLMHRLRDRLPGVSILAVGAAFDMLSGNLPQAPDWLQDRGLEWAYRLAKEPRRLWRRYLTNNPAFAVLLAAEMVRSRRGRG